MKTHSLRWYPERAPRKKLRGKRRYFRSVVNSASCFQLEADQDLNLWHYHADWDGWGNLGWSYRRPHVQALCAVFRNIAAAQAVFRTPFQAWILLNGEDAGQDATFVHTPTLKGAPFPLSQLNIQVDATALAPVFSALLPEMRLRFGWSSTPCDDDGVERRSTAHWIWAEGVGLRLWSR